MRTIALVDILALLVVAAQPVLRNGLLTSEDASWATGFVVVGAVLVAVMAATPWERLTAGPYGEGVLAGLIILGITIVGIVIAAAGGFASEFFWLYVTTSIFSAVVYETRVFTAIMVYTGLSYLASGAFAGGETPTGPVVYRLGLLAVCAFTASYLASFLRHAVHDARVARTEAEAHAERLRTVAEASREMSQLDREGVLRCVAKSVESLGYDMVAVFAVDDAGQLSPAATRNAPPGVDIATYALGDLLHAALTGSTMVVEDVHASPAMLEASRSFGVQTAIVSPVLVAGQTAGLVVAVTTHAKHHSPQDIEVFELLAGQAGRVLELTDEFAREREMVSRLEQLDEAKTDFLSTVSHELRTPLTIILGMSDVLARSWHGLKGEDKQRLVERIRANSDSLERVISSLLDFARIERGSLETRFDRFDLHTQLAAVIDRMEPLLRDHHVSVEKTGDTAIHGDARLLERVIENLLTNAARYTPPGCAIAVTLRAEDASIYVAIADDGPGMTPEDVRRVGERFYRGGDPSTRSVRGLGLGLALVTEVLRVHGARLDIESEPGRGATFSFRLPVEPAPPVLRLPEVYESDVGSRK